MGIEPTSEAWEALYKTLKAIDLAAFSFFETGFRLEIRWKLKPWLECHTPSLVFMIL